MRNKISRIKKLSAKIAKELKFSKTDTECAIQAAGFCKNDLISNMVNEFPELQGKMGYYYSIENGKSITVAKAIKEHYKPSGPEDRVPDTIVGKVIALSDKIDNLVGFFLINEIPTSSRDPNGLRRSALGVIRIIMEGSFSLNLKQLLIFSAKNGEYKRLYSSHDDAYEVINKLCDFFSERLSFYVRDLKGFSPNIINSFEMDLEKENLLNIINRLQVLDDYFKSNKGKKLLSMYRRVANILETEEKKNKKQFSALENSEKKVLFAKEEKLLWQSLINISYKKDLEYSNSLNSLLKLNQPLEDFFGNLLINDQDEDKRLNRLRLLARVREKILGVIDISKIMKGI